MNLTLLVIFIAIPQQWCKGISNKIHKLAYAFQSQIRADFNTFKTVPRFNFLVLLTFFFINGKLFLITYISFFFKVAQRTILFASIVQVEFLFIAKLKLSLVTVQVLLVGAVDADDYLFFFCFLPAYFSRILKQT